MSYQTRNLDDCLLPLPITQAAHRIASQFSQQQPPQKAEQVRLNTLAVCAVNDYLQMMGIPTNLTTSDSWNPIVRLFINVADLEVIGVGRLECRVIKTNEQTCYIPPEVWGERIGYVVVKLDEPNRQATLLGFVKTVAMEQLDISQLRSLEDFLSHLNQLAVVKSVEAGKARVNLSQWLQNVFDANWQTVSSLLNPIEGSLAFSFRKADGYSTTDAEHSNQIRRAKLIDLGLQLAGHSVALVVELRPESHQKIGVLLQVHPTGSQMYLPPLLQLTVLDESGAVFLEAKARRADNYIQLQFSGTVEEKFSVEVALANVSIRENFVI